MLHYRIRFAEPFKDGTIFPVRIAIGTVMVVDENTFQRLVQSGGVVDVIDKLIPRSEFATTAVKEDVVKDVVAEPKRKGRPKKVVNEG